VGTVKADIQRAVDGLAGELEELSRKIHDHPELGYEEIQASGWLSAFLESKGLRVERGVAGVPTAFRATVTGAGEGPTVAVLCEYDALPTIVHACGHKMTMYDLLADPGRVRAAKAEFARG
jgi:metal-dependent amidase/aminoacylase/carboxypeptidase family protein